MQHPLQGVVLVMTDGWKISLYIEMYYQSIKTKQNPIFQ